MFRSIVHSTNKEKVTTKPLYLHVIVVVDLTSCDKTFSQSIVVIYLKGTFYLIILIVLPKCLNRDQVLTYRKSLARGRLRALKYTSFCMIGVGGPRGRISDFRSN